MTHAGSVKRWRDTLMIYGRGRCRRSSNGAGQQGVSAYIYIYIHVYISTIYIHVYISTIIVDINIILINHVQIPSEAKDWLKDLFHERESVCVCVRVIRQWMSYWWSSTCMLLLSSILIRPNKHAWLHITIMAIIICSFGHALVPCTGQLRLVASCPSVVRLLLLVMMQH